MKAACGDLDKALGVEFAFCFFWGAKPAGGEQCPGFVNFGSFFAILGLAKAASDKQILGVCLLKKE